MGRRAGQIFHRSANSIARASMIVLAGAIVGLLWLGLFVDRSPYVTYVGVALAQPVPFSHEHHVSRLGIDCRYCHQSVEKSATAGMPATETCMHCHVQIWSDAPMLAPVRESFDTGIPIQWTRVHDLPDYVYFDHSIHVAKGIGCVTCHGQVDRMPLTWRESTLHMGWCLDCHREPEKYIRPREFVFDLTWTPGENQLEIGRRLVEAYGIDKEGLTNCSICHR